jgi:hypothetical protein
MTPRKLMALTVAVLVLGGGGACVRGKRRQFIVNHHHRSHTNQLRNDDPEPDHYSA